MILKNNRMAQIMIVLIILLIGTAVVIKIFFLEDIPNSVSLIVETEIGPDYFIRICQVLCDRYVNSDFAGPEALGYCEKSFEIDLNKNGKIPGEAGKLNGFGVCEDKVYCFNILECNWGPSEKSRLTPTKCKDIMCDVYTERQGDNVTAAEYIESKIVFGSCSAYDPEISFDSTTGTKSLANWHISTYLPVPDGGDGVHCRGRTG